MQETKVLFLGPVPGSGRSCGEKKKKEDPVEKEMATHSNILAWRIPWTEEPGRLQSLGFQELDRT